MNQMVRFRIFLKREVTKLPEGLNVWYERKSKIKNNLEVPGRKEMPLLEKGSGKEDVGIEFGACQV